MSVEANQETVIVVQEVAVAVTPVGTDGAVVSGQAGVTSVATLVLADWFPALSTAESV